MMVTSGHIDDQAVHVLSESGDDEVVVRLPKEQWQALLTAAAHCYEAQITSVAAVLIRLAPPPSMEEMAEIQESYRRDIQAVLRLLS